MKWLIEWLKWRVAGEEMETLCRYRVNVEVLDRWFASHKDAVEILRWLRQCSEPKLRVGEEWINLSVSGLRGRVEALKAEQELDLKEKLDAAIEAQRNTRAHNRRLQGRIETMEQAGHAVVERWETPFWKDARHTATFIHRLRDALANRPCVRPGHPEVCKNDPKVGCCYWRDCPEFP